MADPALDGWTSAWWDRWPGRLEFELEKLDAAGYRLESQTRESGLLELEITAPDTKTGVGDTRLTVRFPDTYPSTAPQVRTKDFALRHHQHPFHGVLCLIGRSTTYWHATSHLAELLDQQLAKAIAAGSAEAGESHDELDQAEPYVSYYTYTHGITVLLDDPHDTMPTAGAGQATFLIGGQLPPPAEPGARTLCLIDTLQISGAAPHEASATARRAFGPSPQRASGRWVVLDAPVPSDSAAAIWKAAADADTHGAASAGIPGTDVRLRLVGFPDELSATTAGMSWVVVIHRLGAARRHTKGRQSGHPAKRADQGRAPDEYHLGRVERAAARDLTARTPLTAPASTKSVMVLGCGAIGSLVIDHLARAGVGRFMLVDKDDVLEPGNLTRHAATFQGVGLSKAVAMAQHVQAINLHADVRFSVIPVGHPVEMDGRTGGDLLAQLMEDADLVIDATAEVGVQEVTADMARALGKPWLMLSASEGAAGGTVVLADADADWCFACFQWQRVDKQIPYPVSLANDTVQPIGCAEPTFVGAGFDLAEVSLQASRVAAARLLRDVEGAYPADGHDAWTLAMRTSDGTLKPPSWRGHTVERHPSCGAHASPAQ